jgi:hypothetical protein
MAGVTPKHLKEKRNRLLCELHHPLKYVLWHHVTVIERDIRMENGFQHVRSSKYAVVQIQDHLPAGQADRLIQVAAAILCELDEQDFLGILQCFDSSVYSLKEDIL